LLAGERPLTEPTETSGTATTWVAIPAYNCAATVAGVVAAVSRENHPVLVIDDGSDDDTSLAAREAGAEVLRNPQNLGKGASIRRALAWARNRQIERLVTMDGDGQHLASELGKLLGAAASKPDAIVIGQRIVAPAMVSANKLFGNRFANRWVEIACKKAIPDTQSGFRVYPVAATLALGTRARRFAFETEVLIRAVRAGVEIHSQPVRVYYPPADQRTSHYRPFVDTVRIIFVVLGLIFRLY